MKETTFGKIGMGKFFRMKPKGPLYQKISTVDAQVVSSGKELGCVDSPGISTPVIRVNAKIVID